MEYASEAEGEEGGQKVQPSTTMLCACRTAPMKRCLVSGESNEKMNSRLIHHLKLAKVVERGEKIFTLRS